MRFYTDVWYYTPVWNTLFNDFRDFIPTYRTIRQYGIHCFPLFTVKTFLHTDVNFRHFLSKETIMLLEDKYYEMIIWCVFCCTHVKDIGKLASSHHNVFCKLASQRNSFFSETYFSDIDNLTPLWNEADDIVKITAITIAANKLIEWEVTINALLLKWMYFQSC